MDFKNILKTDYLDIIFQGKNKQYGGYELRKKYNGRMLVAALIGLGTMSLLFASTLVDFSKPVVEEEIFEVDKTIAMTEPPPLKPNEPPPPAPTTPPPPAKPTVKFTPPIIKPNEKVQKEEKMVEQKKDEERTSSSTTKEGSNEKGATDFGDLGGKTGGTEQKVEEKQVEKPKEDPNEIKKQIEVKAKFKGNFNSFLASNLNYPAAASAEGISGRVQVQFVVNVDGTVTNVRVLGKGLGGGLNDEAIRVIKKSTGQWEPGTEKGKKYRSVFVQPITFTLQ